MNNEPTDPLTVLVTGVGAPGIRGTLYCLHHNPDGVTVRTIGVDLSGEAVGQHFVDSFSVLVAPEEPGYTDQLIDLCRSANVDLVLPQTTREIARLAADEDRLTLAGVAVMVADSAAIDRANDKTAVLRAFTDAGLPVPDHEVVESVEALHAAAVRLGYPDHPVVVKLPVSNGMRGLRILHDGQPSFEEFRTTKPPEASSTLAAFSEICASAAALPPLLVSEYLPGDEYTVDAFRGEGTEVAVVRRRTVMRSGISFVTDVEPDEEMERQTIEGARALGLEGVFGFQFKRRSDGAPRVLECNPRVQGTMVASALAGPNLIWMGVRATLGLSPGVPVAARAGTRFSRFWGGLAVVDGRVVEI